MSCFLIRTGIHEIKEIVWLKRQNIPKWNLFIEVGEKEWVQVREWYSTFYKLEDGELPSGRLKIYKYYGGELNICDNPVYIINISM